MMTLGGVPTARVLFVTIKQTIAKRAIRTIGLKKWISYQYEEHTFTKTQMKR